MFMRTYEEALQAVDKLKHEDLYICKDDKGFYHLLLGLSFRSNPQMVPVAKIDLIPTITKLDE